MMPSQDSAGTNGNYVGNVKNVGQPFHASNGGLVNSQNKAQSFQPPPNHSVTNGVDSHPVQSVTQENGTKPSSNFTQHQPYISNSTTNLPKNHINSNLNVIDSSPSNRDILASNNSNTSFVPPFTSSSSTSSSQITTDMSALKITQNSGNNVAGESSKPTLAPSTNNLPSGSVVSSNQFPTSTSAAPNSNHNQSNNLMNSSSFAPPVRPDQPNNFPLNNQSSVNPALRSQSLPKPPSVSGALPSFQPPVNRPPLGPPANTFQPPRPQTSSLSHHPVSQNTQPVGPPSSFQAFAPVSKPSFYPPTTQGLDPPTFQPPLGPPSLSGGPPRPSLGPPTSQPSFRPIQPLAPNSQATIRPPPSTQPPGIPPLQQSFGPPLNSNTSSFNPQQSFGSNSPRPTDPRLAGPPIQPQFSTPPVNVSQTNLVASNGSNGMQNARYGPPLSSMPAPNSQHYTPPINTPSFVPNTSVPQYNVPPLPQSVSQPLRPPPQGNFRPTLQGSYNASIPPGPGAIHQTRPTTGYQQNVVNQGWDSAWGTDNINLLHHRNILPSSAIVPPTPSIAQEFVKNCSHDIFRCTFTKVPETKTILQKSKMPFGILIHPFKDLEKLPVVSCQQIVRCKSCRTYINPFVVFRGERRWECNLCFRVNDLPDEFQYDPVSQTYGDPSRRPEVRESTIEYIAPAEYMLRPPQAAIYLWLLDTSRQAVDTGYLKVVCDILLENLDNIPGDRRALIGFMTFSDTVQFYLMPDGYDTIEQLEVGDLDDIFVPHPDELLVNIQQRRPQIEEFLKTLPETHMNTTHTRSALGAALTAAFKLISPLGGRLTVLTTILPTIGPGALQPREDPNQRAANDVMHINPATDFYKKLALDCSGLQVAIDLFALNSHYIDLSTLSGMSKFSGGCVYHFPNFHTSLSPSSVPPFASCLTRYITRKIGFEAVMRIRATRGLAITNFHGHFFVRSPDLLSLPNVNPDAGFAMQIGIEESLHNLKVASFQAALLYTSSRGERRIRVHTLCIPVTANVHDVVNSVDQQASVALLARMAVDRCQSSTATDARDALVNACIDAFSSYHATLNRSLSGALLAHHNLKLWPLYTLALLKSVSFRVGLSTKIDDRIYAMCELKTLPISALITSIYPNLYPVHILSDEGALCVNDELVPQPPLLQLSSEYLNRDGAYLADTGTKMVLYVRSGIRVEWLQDALGIANYASMPQVLYELPEEEENPTARMLRNFIRYLNSKRAYASPLVIIKEDGNARIQFTQLLVDDRTDGSKSYVEFLQFIASSVK